MLASATAGVLGELLRSHSMVLSRSRPNIHIIRPSVHMFLARRRLLGAELERGDGLEGQLGDVDLEQAVGAEAAVVERVTCHSRPS
jgi:hypothetical protein